MKMSCPLTILKAMSGGHRQTSFKSKEKKTQSRTVRINFTDKKVHNLLFKFYPGVFKELVCKYSRGVTNHILFPFPSYKT